MSLIEKAGKAEDVTASIRAAEAEAGVPSDEEYYAEYLPAKEAESVEAEPPPAEVEAEAEPETPAEPEPEPEPEAEVEPEPEKPDQLAELNQKLGRLLNENAELRAQQEQWAQAFTERAQQPQYTADQFASDLDDNPALATIRAFKANDTQAFHRAWAAWNEVAPGAPEIWYDNQLLRGELGTLRDNLAKQVAPAQQLAIRAEVDQALEAARGRHEDFDQVVGTLTEDRAAEIIQDGFPAEILNGLANGDVQAKGKVLETLYRWVKSENSTQLVKAAQENAGKQAEETRAAKVAATVASATTTTPEAVPETEEDRLARVFQEIGPNLRGAWEGQESRRTGR